MKITSMSLYQVPPRWLFLEIETDEGITDWGEPVIEGGASIIKTVVEDFSGCLIGKDPLRIEDYWRVMCRNEFYGGGPEAMSAIAGIDQALWGIKGEYYNVPIYRLLGRGYRDRLRVYSWIGGDRPEDMRQGALKFCETGCTAVEVNGMEGMHYVDSYEKIQEVTNRMTSIRKALGYEIDVGVDFYGHIHKTMAKVLTRELESLKLIFIEEPVLSQNNEALREIAEHTSTLIATDERMFSRWEFGDPLMDGYMDVIQPDLSHAGGINEVKKITAVAEVFGVTMVPHCPLEPITLAVCIQLDTCTPNVFIWEQSLGIHYNKEGADLLDYLVDPNVPRFHDGFIDIPGDPGPGIQLNKEKVVGAARVGHNWKDPVWCSYNGTMAEW